MCRSCWFPDLVALSSCAGARWRESDWWDACVLDDYWAFANQNLSVILAKCWFLELAVWDEACMCSVFTATLTLITRIFDCLLTLMAAAQAKAVHASSLPVDDLNDHHQEWLGSTTMNRYGVAALTLNCVLLRSVDCRPNPCMWWNTWPIDDWCSWPSTGFCCRTHR